MADYNSDLLTAISSFLLDSPYNTTHSAFSENFTSTADVDGLFPVDMISDDYVASFDNVVDSSLVVVAKGSEETVVRVVNGHVSPSTNELINYRDVRVGCKIGFKIQWELENLDDGFKWRKYGKKRVKNNPNPRNYFHCSSEGCRVKKRVERDPEDPRFLLILYDGVHNHSNFNYRRCSK
ncbi:probable WRKY transcription factor 45 [Zingiber officinale]|nr:probable WRKY transcription factor 45 [Zingiber officinale]